MIWYRERHHPTPATTFFAISKNPDAAFARFADFYDRLLPYFIERYPENLDRRHLAAMHQRLIELEAYLRYAMAAVRFRKEDLHMDYYEPLRHLYNCIQETFTHVEKILEIQKLLQTHTWYNRQTQKREMKTHKGTKALPDKELEEASQITNTLLTILHHMDQDKQKIIKAVTDYTRFRDEHKVHEHLSTTTLEQLNYHQIAL